MRTYNIDNFSSDDIHTEHHNKDESGRSKEIEGYIKEVNNWLSENIDLTNIRVADIGCDYGFQLYDLINRFNCSPTSFGIDIYPHPDLLPGVNVCKCEEGDALSSLKGDVGLITYNHTLEHFKQPWNYIPNCILYKDAYIYIGLPKHGTEWATWKGHISTWDLESLVDFMSSFGWELVTNKEVCFRGNNVEFWTIFKSVNRG